MDLIARFVSLCFEVHGLAIVQLHLYYLNEICASEVQHGLTSLLVLPSDLRPVLLARRQLAYLSYAPIHAFIGIRASCLDLWVLFLLPLAVGMKIGKRNLESLGELIILQVSHEGDSSDGI